MENHFHITVNVACQLGTDTQTAEGKGSNLEALLENLGPILGMLGNFGIKPETEAQPEPQLMAYPAFEVGTYVQSESKWGRVIKIKPVLGTFEYKIEDTKDPDTEDNKWWAVENQLTLSEV